MQLNQEPCGWRGGALCAVFADADAGADVRQHSIAQHSTAQHSTVQHFGLGTMLQFPRRRSQDELQLINSIVYEVER